MNNFVNNTQSTPSAITGDMVNSNAQLAMAVSELGRKVDALTAETKKPLSVNITGEATVRPDAPLKWSTKTGHRVRVFPVSIFRFVWG